MLGESHSPHPPEPSTALLWLLCLAARQTVPVYIPVEVDVWGVLCSCADGEGIVGRRLGLAGAGSGARRKSPQGGILAGPAGVARPLP